MHSLFEVSSKAPWRQSTSIALDLRVRVRSHFPDCASQLAALAGKLDDLVHAFILRQIQFELLVHLTSSTSATISCRLVRAPPQALVPLERSTTHSGTNLPPRKCLPLKLFTPCFGAVRLTSTSGVNVGTDSVFPLSSGWV